ncbi:MAG: alanine racemase [Solirubrobacteraceae bacterium]|nr:alanine racemase [Solirubrobacteraceae bacterium]
MSADAGPTPPARVLLESIDVEVVRARLATLGELLATGAARAGRSSAPEVLVASKYFAPAAIPTLLDAGATLLGENRADVIEAKQAAVGGSRSEPSDAAGAPSVDADASARPAALRWDYIGELQSRKATAIAPLVHRIHTLASASAARKLVAYAEAGGEVPELLIQVNVADETAKGGVLPAALPALLEAAAGLPVRGLMTMPPLAREPEESRRWFAALRELAAEHDLTQLSMGTSQDAVVAAQEGATVVRIGGILTSDEAWAALESAHG